jgi:hypothetical protein
MNPGRLSLIAEALSYCQVAEISDTICSRAEGRGFSPVVELGLILGALAPEAMRLQGLKARSTHCPRAAGLKPCPSGSHK